MAIFGIKNKSVSKVFSNYFDINVPVISTVDYDFDYLQVPVIDNDAAARVLEYSKTVQDLQENPGMKKMIEESMARNTIQKQLLDLMVAEGMKQAEESQLQTQALFDYIMGMIFEYLVQPAGIPRDDWSINQDYFQSLTNMVMSAVQTGGETQGMDFRNNFVNNLSYYQTNQGYYNDYAAPMTNIAPSMAPMANTIAESPPIANLTTNIAPMTQASPAPSSINSRVMNIRSLLRNTTGY